MQMSLSYIVNMQDQIKQAGFLINRRAEKQVQQALREAADIQDSDVHLAQTHGQALTNGVVTSHEAGVEGVGWVRVSLPHHFPHTSLSLFFFKDLNIAARFE